jgi:hypothetical protein
VNRQRGAGALLVWLAALAWSVAGSAMSAGAAELQPDTPPPAAAPSGESPGPDEVEELDEVFVEGRRIVPKPRSFKELQKPFDWLARLVGEFDIDGNVDLRAQGRPEDLRNVTGRAYCVGFGHGPGVQCDLRVLWPETKGQDGEDIPGGVSTLNPAVMLLGFEPVLPGISYILVDSDGNADTAVGGMATADIMRSRSRCVDIAGNCERVTQITASPDLQSVELRIDLKIEHETAVQFTFVMRRVPGTDSVVFGRKQGKNK